MSKNDITGDSLRSRELSPEGKERWDLIFPPARKGVCPTCNDDGHACAYPSENKPGCLHFPKPERKCTCAGCSGNCAGHNCDICCGRSCSGEEEKQL